MKIYRKRYYYWFDDSQLLTAIFYQYNLINIFRDGLLYFFVYYQFAY